MNRSPLFRQYLAALFVIVSSPLGLPAADSSRRLHDPEQSLAFARYIATVNGRDPLDQAGPVAIAIEASFPDLYKQASVVAIRTSTENGRPVLGVLGVEGDSAVLSEVVGRYFALEGQLAGLPPSSLAVTPDNYKFRSAGEVPAGETPAYVYQITPKSRRPGLLIGRIWMDSESGAEVLLAGRLGKLRSIGGPVDLVRDTKLRNGLPYGRVTHLAFAIPNLGRAELVVTEYVLRPQGGDHHPFEQPLSAFAR